MKDGLLPPGTDTRHSGAEEGEDEEEGDPVQDLRDNTKNMANEKRADNGLGTMGVEVEQVFLSSYVHTGPTTKEKERNYERIVYREWNSCTTSTIRGREWKGSLFIFTQGVSEPMRDEHRSWAAVELEGYLVFPSVDSENEGPAEEGPQDTHQKAMCDSEEEGKAVPLEDVEILAGGRGPNPTPSEQRKCAHEFPTTDTAENTPKATFTTFTNARPFCKSDVVTDVERRYYTI